MRCQAADERDPLTPCFRVSPVLVPTALPAGLDFMPNTEPLARATTWASCAGHTDRGVLWGWSPGGPTGGRMACGPAQPAPHRLHNRSGAACHRVRRVHRPHRSRGPAPGGPNDVPSARGGLRTTGARRHGPAGGARALGVEAPRGAGTHGACSHAPSTPKRSSSADSSMPESSSWREASSNCHRRRGMRCPAPPRGGTGPHGEAFMRSSTSR